MYHIWFIGCNEHLYSNSSLSKLFRKKYDLFYPAPCSLKGFIYSCSLKGFIYRELDLITKTVCESSLCERVN